MKGQLISAARSTQFDPADAPRAVSRNQIALRNQYATVGRILFLPTSRYRSSDGTASAPAPFTAPGSEKPVRRGYLLHGAPLSSYLIDIMLLHFGAVVNPCFIIPFSDLFFGDFVLFLMRFLDDPYFTPALAGGIL